MKIKSIKLAFGLHSLNFAQLKILKLGGTRYGIVQIKMAKSDPYLITVSFNSIAIEQDIWPSDRVGGIVPYYFDSLLGMAKCFDGKETLDPLPDLKTIIP